MVSSWVEGEREGERVRGWRGRLDEWRMDEGEGKGVRGQREWVNEWRRRWVRGWVSECTEGIDDLLQCGFI